MTCEFSFESTFPSASDGIRAVDTVDAIAKAQAVDLTDVPTIPDWHNAVCRHIVEVTDEDENIVAEFIPLDSPHR